VWPLLSEYPALAYQGCYNNIIMNFTFGIISDGSNIDYINQVLDSIKKQNIPNYEILIIGNIEINRPSAKVINFDETIKQNWITKKKNIITENATYENIVYMHDYLVLDDNWYQGYLKYGNDFKVCINKLINPDGSRFRDWLVWPHSNNEIDKIVLPNRECLIPYDMIHLNKYQYISGSFWVAKKSVMLEFKLNEDLIHGQAEDLDWSFKVRDKYKFSINEYSTTKLLKFKDPFYNITSEETNLKLMELK